MYSDIVSMEAAKTEITGLRVTVGSGYWSGRKSLIFGPNDRSKAQIIEQKERDWKLAFADRVPE